MTPSPHKPMDLSNNFRSELEYFRKFYTHSERIVPRHRTVPCPALGSVAVSISVAKIVVGTSCISKAITSNRGRILPYTLFIA